MIVCETQSELMKMIGPALGEPESLAVAAGINMTDGTVTPFYVCGVDLPTDRRKSQQLVHFSGVTKDNSAGDLDDARSVVLLDDMDVEQVVRWNKPWVWRSAGTGLARRSDLAAVDFK